MCVTVPLYTRLLNKRVTPDDVRAYLTEFYAGSRFIQVATKEETPAFLPANLLSGTNNLKIFVNGNDEQIFVASVFDNLGKGASGAAVQNMNIMFSLPEDTFLK
jgi:N-acetyl-gamma-glutamyl-phosphate reductase